MVDAVLVETGLNTVRVGKLIMSACFVTDMFTVIALSLIFIKPTVWFPASLVASVALIVLLPKISPWFFGQFGDHVIEAEIKLVFAILLDLMVLGSQANSQAVLPAFILGLIMSRHYQRHQEERRRLRVVAFAFNFVVGLRGLADQELRRLGSADPGCRAQAAVAHRSQRLEPPAMRQSSRLSPAAQAQVTSPRVRPQPVI